MVEEKDWFPPYLKDEPTETEMDIRLVYEAYRDDVIARHASYINFHTKGRYDYYHYRSSGRTGETRSRFRELILSKEKAFRALVMERKTGRDSCDIVFVSGVHIVASIGARRRGWKYREYSPIHKLWNYSMINVTGKARDFLALDAAQRMRLINKIEGR